MDLDFEDIAAAFCAEAPFDEIVADPKPRPRMVGGTAVAAALSVLGSGWIGLHSLPIGPGNTRLDHLVLGPGGVFAINARCHPGRAVWVSRSTFVVGRQRMPYIRSAEHDASRVRRLLGDAMPDGLDVSALIVLVAPGTVSVRQQPANAVVLDVRGLARWLRRRPEILDAGTVDALADAAAASTNRHRASATA